MISLVGPSRVLEGAGLSDLFGNSVAGAGDVNNDGFGDLIVGAYAADPMGRSNAGTVSVYHGAMGGIPGMANRVLEGAGVNDQFGWSVASLQGRALRYDSFWANLRGFTNKNPAHAVVVLRTSLHTTPS